MRDKFAIDTNIIFYAIDKDSEKQQKALDFLKKSRNKEAAISLRALAECYNLSLHRNNIESGDAEKFVYSLKHDPDFKIISSDKKALNNSIGAKNDFWDKLMEQTTLENGYDLIYTENTSDFEEVEAINPLKEKE